MADLTTAQVWKVIEDNIFAVLGMVSAKQEARTAGIVYAARGGKLYISSQADAWKVRHLANNPHVSLTVAIPKRVPLMPWIKVPAATITFAGTATVIPAKEADPEILPRALPRPCGRRSGAGEGQRHHRRTSRRLCHLRRRRLAHGDPRYGQGARPRAGAQRLNRRQSPRRRFRDAKLAQLPERRSARLAARF